MNDKNNSRTRFSTHPIFHVMGEGWYGETVLGLTVGPYQSKEDLLDRLEQLNNEETRHSHPSSQTQNSEG